MPRKFFEHAKPKHWPLGCVIQHVQADEAGIEIPAGVGVHHREGAAY
jgi:hypothetical protein